MRTTQKYRNQKRKKKTKRDLCALSLAPHLIIKTSRNLMTLFLEVNSPNRKHHFSTLSESFFLESFLEIQIFEIQIEEIN